MAPWTAHDPAAPVEVDQHRRWRALWRVDARAHALADLSVLYFGDLATPALDQLARALHPLARDLWRQVRELVAIHG